MIIEIDGSQHYTEQGLAYDKERSALLQQYGIKIIRFSNRDINYQFRYVCDAIHQEIEKE